MSNNVVYVHMYYVPGQKKAVTW